MIKKLYQNLSQNGEYITLNNGLKIIFKQVPLKTVSVFLQVNTGSIFEKGYWGSGLSHFFEHSLFLGSKNFPKPDDFSFQIESYGGSNINAYTTYDHTAYYFNILPEYLQQAIKDFSDFVFQPLFPQKAVKNEIGTIVSEMDMQNDSVSSSFYYFCNEFSFETLPYKLPIIGYKDLFLELSRQELLQYYKEQYAPNNMILTIVGDFELTASKKSLQKTIQKYWGKYQPQKIPTLEFVPEKPWQKETVETSHPQATFPRIMMMWQSATLNNKNFVAFDLLTSILTDNDSSLLSVILRDKKKIVQNIEANSWSSKEMGQFRLEIDLPTNCDTPEKIKKTITKIENEVFNIFKQITAESFSKKLGECLESAKRSIINQTIKLQENGQELASSLAHSLTQQGNLFFERDYLKKIMSLSSKDISQIVNSFLKKDNFKLALLLPAHLISKQKQDTNSPLILEKALPIHQQMQSQQSKESLHEIDNHLKIIPPKRKRFSFNFVRLLNNNITATLLASLTNKLRSNNGNLTILAKNKHEAQPVQPLFLHRQMKTLPKISLLFMIKGGSFYEELHSSKGSAKKASTNLILNGSFYLLTKMLKTATQKYSAIELNTFLAKHGIEIIPFASSHYFGFKLYFLADKITEAAEIFEQIIFKQHFTLANLQKEKQDLLFKIHSKNEDPWALLQEHFKKDFYKNTPFKNDLFGNKQSVNKITLPLLKKLLQKSLQKKNISLSLYGDISLSLAKRKFLKILNNLPNEKTDYLNKEVKTSLDSIPPHSDSVKIKKSSSAELQQSYFQIGYRAPDEFSADHIPFKLFKNTLSGMGGPLFKMRSQPFVDSQGVSGGRCYQLGCSYQATPFYGTFVLFAGLRKGAEKEYQWFIDSFAKIIKKRFQKDISDLEYQRAKNLFIGNQRMYYENVFYLMMNEMIYLLEKNDPFYYQKHLEQIHKINKEDLRQILKKYFREKRFIALLLAGKN